MKLSIGDITIDQKLNVRDELDEDTIERYRECFDQLPPVVVFEVDSTYLLADGFHRYKAAKRLDRTEIKAEIKQGGRKDAEEHAALANLTHGKPLTRSERKKAVERMLKLYPERADNWIAQDMGVSKNTVAKYREELEAGCQIDRLNYFIGKDGKRYPRNIEQPQADEKEAKVEPKEQVDTETPEQETPSSTVVEVEDDALIEDDTTEELKADVSDEVIDSTQDDDNGTQTESRVVSRRPAKLPPDAPEGWDTFYEYSQWIEDYTFNLLKEDIHYARRVHRSLELLVTRLEEVLEELDESS